MSSKECNSTECDASSCAGCEKSDAAVLAQRMAGIKRKLVVLSGKGGVGKSTVALNLAVSLSMQGLKVGLLDVDVHGPSIPTMLGLQGQRLESDGELIVPYQLGDLSVVSVGLLTPNPEDAIIWRGPMKAGVIQQFLKDVDWGQLDALVIDCPPGTGDEPLSVCQLVGDGAAAVVVTTPQEVALADVRRSISFCRQLELPIWGVVENMSGFACPHCQELTDVFPSSGAEEMASSMRVPFLGKIPLEPGFAQAGDTGVPYVRKFEGSAAAQAFAKITEPIITRMSGPAQESCASAEGEKKMKKFAFPVADGKLCMHFGHCEKFVLLTVEDEKVTVVTGREELTPPPHEPGVLPKWLAEQGATHIIAGGMGQRAQGLFAEAGISVTVGAPAEAPETLLDAFLAGTLECGGNVCDH